MTRLHRKNATRRRGLTREKVRQLLTSRDFFNDGSAYGANDALHGKTFDEGSARLDWDASRVLLLAEFESANPGKVCFASARFDDVPVPNDQHSFSGFRLREILNMFPIGTKPITR